VRYYSSVIHTLPPIYFHEPPHSHEKKLVSNHKNAVQYSKEQTKFNRPTVGKLPCQRPASKRLLRSCLPRADVVQRLTPRLYPQRAHPTPTRVSPHRTGSPARQPAHPERRHCTVEDPNPKQREQTDGERRRRRGASSAGRRGYYRVQASWVEAPCGSTVLPRIAAIAI
jgi:hypothetical protein